MILIRVDLPVNSSQQYIFDLRWCTDGTNADYHIWVVDGRLQKRRDKNSRLCEGCTESRLKTAREGVTLTLTVILDELQEAMVSKP